MIGLYKCRWAGNGAIDVTFSGEMDDRVDDMLG